MPKIQPRPLKHKELIEKLSYFGVIEHPNNKRGKGSERILILAANYNPETKKYHGPQYPIKCHGDGTEIHKPVISKLLDRFNIDPIAFWSRTGSA